MHHLRCVAAEWQLVRARLLRSRLGVWLLLLGAVGAWLAAHGVALAVLVPHVAMLAAVLGVAFGVGSEADRAALALTLTHPTTPLAVAAGRWLAALTVAGVLAAGLLVAGGGVSALPAGRLAQTGAAALGAAAAAAGCALLAAGPGGNVLAGALFLYIALPSVVSADALRAAPSPGVSAQLGALVLEVLPGVWRYRALVTGDGAAWCHATIWAVAGVAGAAACLRRPAV